MFASALIISFSAILLVYWFRYSCILLLRNYAEQHAAAPATESQFGFSAAQSRLESGSLDDLHSALDHDYRVLCYLLRHASGLSPESFEDRLLVLDYKVMQCWYRLTRTAFPEAARHALGEMSTVLGFLDLRMGARAGSHAA